MSYVLILLVEMVFLLFSSRLMTKSLSFLPINVISFIFLPGIIFHELSHLFVASILFVPTGEIEFMPKVEGQSIKLGSVSIGKTDPIRRFLIGVSPVLVGILIIGLVLYFAKSLTAPFYINLLIFYILFVIGNTMFSSSKDMEGSLVLLILAVVLTFTVYLSGVKVPSEIFTALASKADLLKQVDFFLPFIILIDLTMFTVGKRLRS